MDSLHVFELDEPITVFLDYDNTRDGSQSEITVFYITDTIFAYITTPESRVVINVTADRTMIAHINPSPLSCMM